MIRDLCGGIFVFPPIDLPTPTYMSSHRPLPNMSVTSNGADVKKTRIKKCHTFAMKREISNFKKEHGVDAGSVMSAKDMLHFVFPLFRAEFGDDLAATYCTTARIAALLKDLKPGERIPPCKKGTLVHSAQALLPPTITAPSSSASSFSTSTSSSSYTNPPKRPLSLSLPPPRSLSSSGSPVARRVGLRDDGPQGEETTTVLPERRREKRETTKLRIKVNDESVFARIWDSLKEEGWTWAIGSRLVNYYYIPPNRRSHRDPNAVEGFDYFTAESKVLDSLETRGRTAEEAEIEALQLDAKVNGETNRLEPNKRGDERDSTCSTNPSTPSGHSTRPQDPGYPLLSIDEDESMTSQEKMDQMYEWRNLWGRLKRAGWCDKRPSSTDLTSQWHYIRPGKSVSDGVRGVDYFGSKEGVIEWVKERDTMTSSKNRVQSSVMSMLDDEAEMDMGKTQFLGKVTATAAHSDGPSSAQKRRRVMNDINSALDSSAPNASTASTTPSSSSAASGVSATTTVRAMIDVAKVKLNPSLYIEAPQLNRDAEYTELMKFLKSSVDNFGGKGSYYAGGVPGTGKTVTIKRACDEAVRYAEKSKDKTKIPSVVHINMGSFRSAATGGASSKKDQTSLNRTPQQRIFDAIADALGVEEIDDSASGARIHKQSMARSQSSIEKKLMKKKGVAKKHVILVMDEMDLLVESKNGSDNTLYALFRWSSNSEMSFTLIGISNVVDLRHKHLSRLGNEGEGNLPNVCIFEPYDKDSLISIITERVGPHFFQPSALEMIARKVSATWGDCRRTLDLAQQCLAKACDTLSIGELDEPYVTGNPDKTKNTVVVKMPHVLGAIKESSMTTDHCAAIATLPQLAQMVLCVAVAVASGETNGRGGATIMQGELQNICKEATREGFLDKIDSSMFTDLLLTLSDAGLLDINKNDRNFHDTESRKRLLTLKCAMDDVEEAIERTLGSLPFFASLMQRMKGRN